MLFRVEKVKSDFNLFSFASLMMLKEIAYQWLCRGITIARAQSTGADG